MPQTIQDVLLDRYARDNPGDIPAQQAVEDFLDVSDLSDTIKKCLSSPKPSDL